MKRLMWIWKRFWGNIYHIEYSNELKNNEILVYGHKIIIGKFEKNK